MADGSVKAIASVQPGDWVKSRNEATGQDEARQVMASVKRLAPAVVTVSLADSKTGKAETLTCTPEHTLFVQGQGWVEAGSVGIGTSIVSRAGPALEVTNLTWEKNKAEELAAGTGSSFGGYTVYNLTVEGDHTFFVGSAGGGTWVHNINCFRGGSDMTVKPGEVKVQDGLVQPTHGISVHEDPAKMARFGGANQIGELPDGLKIIQRGRDILHHEIVPSEPMPLDQYQGLLNQIPLTPVNP